MISPQDCVLKILVERPDFAEALYDLLICARYPGGAFTDAALDEAEEIAWSKTPEAQRQREAYKKRKLPKASKLKPTEAALPV